MTNDRPKMTPMRVDNMGFLLETLGADCAPLQFIRELTMNAIEAIQALRQPQGEIVWDVEATQLESFGAYKLCVIDTGIGMTGPEMVRYINHLACSGKDQHIAANFGVGAKIAAATRNPEGLVYFSWKGGKGAMVHLWKDPSNGLYGLKRFQLSDGSYGDWCEVNDEVKPKQIVDHGTMVVLLGAHPDANTMEAPEGVSPRHRWITTYLNTRFFELPDGITIQAREGWDSQGKDSDRLRGVTGSRKFLDKWAEQAGSVQLSNAVAHWWILSPDAQGHGFNLTGGHTALVFRNEMYDLRTRKSGAIMLQTFGVNIAHSRVVIYVEPDKTKCLIKCKTARESVLIDGENPNWAEWASQFRNQFPVELKELIERSYENHCADDYKKTIKDRLKQVEDIYKLKRYRPSKTGIYKSANFEDTTPAPTVPTQPTRFPLEIDPKHQDARRCRERRDDVYAAFIKANGEPSDFVPVEFDIDVRWVSEAEMAVRDRAARYNAETKTLFINSEFRIFTQFVERWEQHYQRVPFAKELIGDVVREWFQQALYEVVLSAEKLKGESEWTQADMDNLLSEEALTAAVLPRYHIETSVKRDLSVRLGKLRHLAS